jgi:hypothetical protein
MDFESRISGYGSKFGMGKSRGTWGVKLFRRNGIPKLCYLVRYEEIDNRLVEDTRGSNSVPRSVLDKSRWREVTLLSQSTHHEDFIYDDAELEDYDKNYTPPAEITKDLVKKLQSSPEILYIVLQYVIDDFIRKGYVYRWRCFEFRPMWKFICNAGWKLVTNEEAKTLIIQSKMPTSISRLSDCTCIQQSMNNFIYLHASFRFGYYFECDGILMTGNRGCVVRAENGPEIWQCHNCMPLTNCRLVHIEDCNMDNLLKCGNLIDKDYYPEYDRQSFWDRTWDLKSESYVVSDFAKDLKFFCRAMFNCFAMNMMIYGGGKNHNRYIHGATMELIVDNDIGLFWFDSEFSFCYTT